MRKGTVDNNQMATSDMVMSAVGLVPNIAAVTGITYVYKMDAQGKRTAQIEGVRYRCANPSDFSVFTLKTLSIKPVITPEELDASEDVVYISIPVNDVAIKPYKIEYGVATVSIIAPYVKLVTDEKLVKQKTQVAYQEQIIFLIRYQKNSLMLYKKEEESFYEIARFNKNAFQSSC